MHITDTLGKDAETKIKEWVDVPGYEGQYAISKTGDVLSKSRIVECRNGAKLHIREKLLKQHEFSSGYKYVVLTNSKGSKNLLLHRVVASAFIPNPYNLPEVNHIDGDKHNNCVSNLEWCTSAQNIQHAISTGLIQQSPHSQLVNMGKARGKQISKSVKCIETGKVYNSIKECAEDMSIRVGYIYEYMRGDAKSCHGYHFEVVDDRWTSGFHKEVVV